MHITIKTYTDTRNMEVPQTESALYKAIGEQLLNLSVPNRLLVSTPVGEAEFDVKQRGTFAKDGTIYPSMYVTEEYNTIQLPQDTYIDRRYNVSVDVINYTPVTLDELIAQNDVK